MQNSHILADPHLLEGRQWSQDWSTDPDRVLSLWRSNDFDLHGRWSQCGNFFLHSVSNTRVHGGTTGQDGVCVQILTDINVALHDWVVRSLVNTSRFHTQERWLNLDLSVWLVTRFVTTNTMIGNNKYMNADAVQSDLEESLRATESFVTNSDYLTIRKFIRLLKWWRWSSGGHFLLKVECNIAKLLLDVTNNFTLCGCGEWVTTLSEDLHQVVSQVTTCQIKTEDSVWKSVSFVDRNSVCNT